MFAQGDKFMGINVSSYTLGKQDMTFSLYLSPWSVHICLKALSPEKVLEGGWWRVGLIIPSKLFFTQQSD